MKKHFFGLILFFLFSFPQFVFSQLQTAGGIYDTNGIQVNVTKDLSDTLTALPGTHARILLPKFFEPFSYGKIVGFIHKGTSSTIMAMEYPGISFINYTNQISDSLFKAQGVELLQVLEMKQKNGGPAKAYIVRAATSNGNIIRIMYFTGDYQTMYYLIANIPESVSKLIRNVMLASMQTLEF